MTDREIIAIIGKAMSDADIAWDFMPIEERAGKRPSDLKATAVLRALRKADLIAKDHPCAS